MMLDPIHLFTQNILWLISNITATYQNNPTLYIIENWVFSVYKLQQKMYDTINSPIPISEQIFLSVEGALGVPKKPKVENSKSYPPEILDMVKWFPKSPKIWKSKHAKGLPNSDLCVWSDFA